MDILMDNFFAGCSRSGKFLFSHELYLKWDEEQINQNIVMTIAKIQSNYSIVIMLAILLPLIKVIDNRYLL